MRSARLMDTLKERWQRIWSKPMMKQAVIIAGSALLCGTFYYPIIKKIMSPAEIYTKEQKAFFDKDALYPIKVRKRQEHRASDEGHSTLKSTR